LNEAEVTQLRHLGYNPADYYFNNRELKRTIDYMNNVGVGGKSFSEISKSITNYDPYMVLADYADYRLAQKRSDELYSDSENWSRMSLMNISGAGRFAADRAIREYADNIWGSPSAFGFEIKDKSKGK
jgi:starch phosphorylase